MTGEERLDLRQDWSQQAAPKTAWLSQPAPRWWPDSLVFHQQGVPLEAGVLLIFTSLLAITEAVAGLIAEAVHFPLLGNGPLARRGSFRKRSPSCNQTVLYTPVNV